MKKSIINIGIIACLLTVMVFFTGCGDEKKKSNNNANITDELNSAVQKHIEWWDKAGGWTPFTMRAVRSELDDRYVIINCGNNEYTTASGYTEYTTQLVGGSSWKLDNVMPSNGGPKYTLIYDSEKKSWYSVEIEYGKTKYNDTVEIDYPIFKNAKKIE